MKDTIIAASIEEADKILTSEAKVMVDYYKDNCPGCKMLDASIAKVADLPQFEGVVLLKIKLETVGEDYFRDLGLRQTPTLSFFRNGEEVSRLPGFQAPNQITQTAERAFKA